MDKDFRKIARRKLSLWQTLKAIAWGALGLRRGQGHQDDISRVNPVVLIVSALLATLLFIIVLIAIARYFSQFYT